MTDPYKVLGISPSSTDEQVKSAYRELAKKYHPDSYADNPLADLAQEKMKAINEAYDQIMKERQSGGQQQGGYQNGGYAGGPFTGRTGGGYGGSSQFADIRRLIRAGRMEEAEELLNGVPSQNRDGEWYFLKGNIAYSRGWMDQATEYFTRACNMNPTNQEYKAALNQLMWQQNGGMRYNPYNTTNTSPAGGGCTVCDLCSGLICLDCLCGNGGCC